MITIYPYKQLGKSKHKLIDSRHHFSFANYYNPKRLAFGPLIVINDDVVGPYMGFDSHPHDNMEIITYVRKGAVTHQDSRGNKGRSVAGDVQVMSAGRGIYHSEHNLEDEEGVFYQIWIRPNKKNVTPRWDSAKFPKGDVIEKLPLLVSGDKNDGVLFINQNAKIFGGTMAKNTKINHAIAGQAYVLVSYGKIRINNKVVNKGDGAEVTNISNVIIESLETSEVIIIDVPK